MSRQDYDTYDYLIGMDQSNIRNMTRIAGGDPEKKIYKMMEFTGSGRDVADPWYTGDFEATYRDVSEGMPGIAGEIERKFSQVITEKLVSCEKIKEAAIWNFHYHL